MKRHILVLIPILLLASARTPAAALQDTGQCQIPTEFTTDEDTLVHVKSAIANGRPLEVLAVGSATTLGQDLLPQGSSFPYRMVRELEAALPGAQIKLTVLGGRGLSAAEMLELVKKALQDKRFTLVLWQTGTVEAVHQIEPGDFRDVLSAGIAAIKAQDGDVLLIDPQFSQFLTANSDISAYEQVFHEEAALPGVVEFRRFDLMRSWAEKGQLDLEHVSKEQRGAVLERLHGCLGLALSRLVLAASGQPVPVKP